MASGVAQVMEEFDKRRGRLENSYNSLQQRVDQGNKLREGVGTRPSPVANPLTQC